MGKSATLMEKYRAALMTYRSQYASDSGLVSIALLLFSYDGTDIVQ